MKWVMAKNLKGHSRTRNLLKSGVSSGMLKGITTSTHSRTGSKPAQVEQVGDVFHR